MPEHEYALPPGTQIQHYRIDRLLGTWWFWADLFGAGCQAASFGGH